MDFSFETDEETREICSQIIREMTEECHITPQEALGRMNRLWRAQRIIGDYTLHAETPGFLACLIYYENWKECTLTGSFKELRIRPYP
jgi:hypothetical protein